MPFTQDVEDGEARHWNHGVCWYNYDRASMTVAPVPLNIIYRALYAALIWCYRPFRNYELVFHDHHGGKKNLAGDYERFVCVVIAFVLVAVFGVGVAVGCVL